MVCVKGDSQQSRADACVPLHRLLQVATSPILQQQVRQESFKPKYQKGIAVLVLSPEYLLCHDTWSSASKTRAILALSRQKKVYSFIPAVPTQKIKDFLYWLFCICLQNIWFLEYILNRTKEETGHI